VLLTGFDKKDHSVFYVNDPYYNTTTYNYSDIADIITYFVVMNRTHASGSALNIAQ